LPRGPHSVGRQSSGTRGDVAIAPDHLRQPEFQRVDQRVTARDLVDGTDREQERPEVVEVEIVAGVDPQAPAPQRRGRIASSAAVAPALEPPSGGLRQVSRIQGKSHAPSASTTSRRFSLSAFASAAIPRYKHLRDPSGPVGGGRRRRGVSRAYRRAGYRARTDDIQLGKLTLYQLS
jgi:hypothetical protein